jgi:hypothetical protein
MMPASGQTSVYSAAKKGLYIEEGGEMCGRGRYHPILKLN